MELAPSLPKVLRREVRQRLAEPAQQPATVLDLGELLDEQSALVALLAALVGNDRRYSDLGRILLPADHALLATWQPIAAREWVHLHDGRRSPQLDGPSLASAAIDVMLLERLGEGPVRLRVGERYLAVAGLHPVWLATWRRHGLSRPTWLADHRRLALLPAGAAVEVD